MEIIEAALKRGLVALDTETTGIDWTSRPVGVSLAVNIPSAILARYYAWGHQGGGNDYTWEQVKGLLEQLDRPHMTIVMHNAIFDMRMLALQGFRFRQATVVDTGLIASLLFEYEPSFSLGALGKKYCQAAKSDKELNEWCAEMFGGPATRNAQAKNYWRAPASVIKEYAEEDARITLELYNRRWPKIAEEGLEDIFDLETRQFPVLLDLYLEGVLVDVERTEAVKVALEKDYLDLVSKWREYTNDANIRSGKQLQVLFDEYEIPYPRTEKGNPSFPQDYLATLTDEYPLVDLLLKLRRLATLTGTFIDGAVLGHLQSDGKIHCNFNSYISDRGGAISGRYSSSDPNLQNIPARDEIWAPLIRGLFIPMHPEWRWAKADYSQIEYRLFAHYAGGVVAERYRKDPTIDFHEMVAELTGHPRKHAKNINFASLYGAGVAKIARMMGTDRETAEQVLQEYHDRLPEVGRLSREVVTAAKRRQFIWSIGGRKHRFPGRLQAKNRKAQAWKALNRLCQGGAADLIKAALIEVHAALDLDHARMHLTVHDELDFSFDPGAQGQKQLKIIKECMEQTAVERLSRGPLNVPVLAEINTGPDWGHVE